MTTSHLSEAAVRSLPPCIRAAQAAIHFPEVQDMLRKLSEYDLGICMPHMHDELTGDFASLPPGFLQVESALTVSFQAAADLSKSPEPVMPVAWAWRGGESVPVSACVMVSAAETGGPDDVKHKM